MTAKINEVDGARKITKGAFVNLSGDVLDLVGVPVLYLLIGRLFNAQALGTYILVVSCEAILLRLAVLGFDKAMLRFIPAAEAEDAATDAEVSALGTALRWTLGMGFALSAAAAWFPGMLLSTNAAATEPTAATWLAIMALALPAQAVTRVLLFALRGRNVMTAFVVVQSGVLPMSLLAASVLPAILGCGPAALPWGFVISSVVTMIAAFVAFRRYYSYLSLRSILLSRRNAALLKFSFPQGLSEALNFVLARIDVVMIGAFFPDRMELVAFYGVASLLAGIVKRVRIAFDNSFSPVFAKCHADKDHPAMARTYRETSAAITTLFILIAGVICFASPSILSLYGKAYEKLWIVVPVLVLGRLMNAVGGPAQAALLMSGRSRLELLNNFILCGVNVAFNFILIPRFHVYGAALASAVTLTLFNIVRIVEVWYLLNIRINVRSAAISLLIGAAAAVPGIMVVEPLPTELWRFTAAAVVFGAAYLLLSMTGKENGAIRRFLVNNKNA